MKNTLIALTVLLSIVSFTSCRETETKEVVREVRVEVDTKDDDPSVLERAAKEVDKEVNEEVDKAIDKIGNDD